MLKVTNLSMQFGGRTLFKDVNLTFNKGDCYGIIGANGAGKSTFLRIVTGELEPTTGFVELDKTERMSVLNQNHEKFNDVQVLRTVLLGNKRLVEIMDEKDALYAKEDFTEEDGIKAGELENEFAEMNGWDAETEATNLLNNLGVPEKYHTMLVKDLDKSLRVKVLLAQALFGNPDILVLDEPTNDLDPVAAAWLEDFLADFENTILIVSHDRYFLNKVCTKILDVDYNQINLFVGNYDFWYQSSQLMQKQAKDQNAKKEQKIKELQEFIARFSANASKSRQATSRKKLLEKITLDDLKPSSRRYPWVDFKYDRELGKDVLFVENLTLNGFFNNLSFVLNNTDKVAFISSNQLAITNLFEILNGRKEADSGSYKFGITVEKEYFSSSLAEFDDVEENLVDYLRPYSSETLDSYIRSYLGRMLFSQDEALKQVKVLSGGEKVRLKLTRLQLHPGNVMFFDDPTNHLDLESIESLNRGLVNYKGVLLFSSHDHEFLNTIANRIIYIKDNGSYIDYIGTYDEFLPILAAETASKNR